MDISVKQINRKMRNPSQVLKSRLQLNIQTAVIVVMKMVTARMARTTLRYEMLLSHIKVQKYLDSDGLK